MQFLKVQLLTADLSATEQFYAATLGLPVHRPAADCVAVQVGSSVVKFRQAPTGAAPFYHVAFTVPANQIEAAQTWLQARLKLLPVTETGCLADFRNWQAQALYFHDPSGNILECIARAPLRNHSAQPFGPHSFLALSEVGLVVPNVPAYCQLLAETHGIVPFPRGPVTPEFAALGSDEGLLIVSAQGRGWVPTRRAAEAHPLRVTLHHHGAVLTLTLSGLGWPQKNEN